MSADMNMLLHVVEHMERWRIPRRYKQFDTTELQTNLTLPDHDLQLFLAWAGNLDGVLITATATYARTAGVLYAHGHLLSGHVLHVYVTSDSERMRRAGLRGPVLIGQVEQYRRRNMVGLPVPDGAL